MKLKNHVTESILNLPRFAKSCIAALCDLSLCVISVAIAFYLRLDQLPSLKEPFIIASSVSFFLAIPIFWLTGLYRLIFRYSSTSIIFSLSIAILVYGLLYFCIFVLFRIEGIPRSIGIIQPMLLFFAVLISRLLAKLILGKSQKSNKQKLLKGTLVYGAGDAGRHVVSLLKNSLEFKVKGFIDDNDKLHGQILLGYNIYSPNQLEHLIETEDIKIVLLAIPSVNRFRRNQILKILNHYNLIVHTLPSVMDIVEGRINISDIKDLEVNDILNREIVPPKKDLLFKNIEGQVILVTGAGGSIGSELCRQIIRGNPKALILCELNEFALYRIFEELNILNKDLKIVPLICNIQDEEKINKILKVFKVNTLYHAAAYKHVPLVESNICEGVSNNVFGTYVVSKACIQQNVNNFVLVSSDKAVRPTNIMGASKRLAELCVQALYHHNKNHNINMSIVRFGNVLDSSGSVIPKFKRQIKNGGPITLTHPEVTRYFMTISESAQLVMQAGAMSKECSVFVLDMGESIKIKDLIYRIVKLSGLTIKDEKQVDGDIEIKIIGLREGEKLYEELLMGDSPQTTAHKKIHKAQDKYIPFQQLEKNLITLKSYLINIEAEKVKSLLEEIVSSYRSEYKITDYLYNEDQDNLKSNNFTTNESSNIINIK